jgi:DNA-binding response OmpR family regulator
MDGRSRMHEARSCNSADPMGATQQLVVVVDDDAGVRRALQRWLLASGYRTREFDSAERCSPPTAHAMRTASCSTCGCPAHRATELYAQLGSDRPPAVFITSHDGTQVRSAVAGLGGGAVLPKPFLGQDLIAAIADATVLRRRRERNDSPWQAVEIPQRKALGVTQVHTEAPESDSARRPPAAVDNPAPQSTRAELHLSSSDSCSNGWGHLLLSDGSAWSVTVSRRSGVAPVNVEEIPVGIGLQVHGREQVVCSQ